MGGRIVVKRGRIRVPDQHHLPLARLEVELHLAGPGRGRAGRRRAGARPLRLPDSPRYAWPLPAASARACAAAIASAAAAADHGLAEAARHLLDRLRGLAEKVNTAGPLQEAHRLTFAAEAARTGGYRLLTPHGSVTAAKLVYATNAYSHLFGELGRLQAPPSPT
jgi:glycine/D-amino acid oxidase-like deaminating enzyme